MQGRGYQFVADVRVSRAAERLEPHADKDDDLTTLEGGTQTLRSRSAMGRAHSAAGARRQKAGLAIGGGVVLGAVTMGLTVWALLRPEPPHVVRLTMSHPSGETVAAKRDRCEHRDLERRPVRRLRGGRPDRKSCFPTFGDLCPPARRAQPNVDIGCRTLAVFLAPTASGSDGCHGASSREPQ